MKPFKSRMLNTTFIPAVIAAGVLVTFQVPEGRANPCAARKSQAAANPCAARNPCGAANPCAAANPCNPCAAANPCNPCAAANPCNPCAAAAGARSNCVVPRSIKAAANPCAAKNPCNPCAAKSPCNPCAAKNPCNPCAAANPCNPCAAKNPCNPCAAKNPCNPCAAANPCNPCAAAPAASLSAKEARAAYNCLKPTLASGYAKSGNRLAKAYVKWRVYNTRPYTSDTHGARLVNNYANRKARSYRKFEKSGPMPKGAVLAKDSFVAHPNGRTSAGPLFLMEKMGKGFSPASGDWRYTLIMPNGRVIGTTRGRGAANVKFCYECHMSVAEEQDSMMFLPQEVRLR